MKRRYAELHPERPPLDSVRFVMGQEITAGYDYPAGRWSKPPFEQLPDGLKTVMSTHFFDGRPPTDDHGRPVNFDAIGTERVKRPGGEAQDGCD